MRFQVPQNLDVPDTIFFGLGFKQLFYIIGSLGWSAFVFLFLGGFVSAVFLGGPVIVFALLLSFFSFNTQPFIVILQVLIQFLFKKKMYVWKKIDSHYMPKQKSKRKKSDASSNGDDSGKRVNTLSAKLLFDENIQTSDSDPEIII